MSHRTINILVTAGLATFTPTAFAAEDDAGFHIWADVVDVQPLVTTRYETHPVPHCPPGKKHQRQHRLDQSNTEVLPVLFGGVIGGVIGHQFGSGNGKKAMTLIGALTGASIAGSRHRNNRDYRNVSRGTCRTGYEKREIQEIDGYQVTYRYLGREFERVTNEHPGNKIKLYVTAQPVSTTLI